MNPYHSAPRCYILVLQATERKEGDHVNHDNHVLPWQPCVAMTTMVITCQPWSWQDVTNLNHWYYFQPASFPILIPQLLFPCSTYKYPIYLHSWSEWRPANKANSFRHVNVSQYCVDLHCIGVFISSGGGGGVLSTGIHQPRCKALRSILQTHVPQGTHWAQGWCKTV